MDAQLRICDEIRTEWAEKQEKQPLALVDTYGCQQNEADSEQLRGMLRRMGLGFTEDPEEAAIIVINTCAVREHAESRVLGNVGALAHTKKRHPEQIICMCGCAMQEPRMSEKIRRSFRHVDLVFGPQVLWKFPGYIQEILKNRGRIFETPDVPGQIAEGLPVVRRGKVKAWVSIMYGCNNFCTYCIVPYVRGRERSRAPELIVEECRQLVAEGYKEITLLGQNVNSYGKDLGLNTDFSDLLRMVNDIPGDFLIRFMTSHPKDASDRLFHTMAECEKVAPALHLPFQAGNDRVLAAMNRRYTHEDYLRKVEALRSLIPDIVLTSDVIVGFPGETNEEFQDTIRLLEEVRFDSLFTFLYSRRDGTPAAELPDVLTKEEKNRNFQQLLEVQNRISAEKHAEYVGKTYRVLVDGTSSDPEHGLSARTAGGRLVHMTGPESLVGTWTEARITDSSTWALYGEPAGMQNE